jgi:hypothetical protein
MGFVRAAVVVSICLQLHYQFSYGEGPLISLAFTSLGLVLLFHRQIARLLAGPAPQPDPGTPPPA